MLKFGGLFLQNHLHKPPTTHEKKKVLRAEAAPIAPLKDSHPNSK
jgi:hypothetical protein